MQELLAKETGDHRAAEAIALFCYQARKFLGALAAVLSGLETLVFTGGIGENAPSIRSRICEGLEFLGIRLDPALNSANAAIISTERSHVRVRVMKTDESIMIARYTEDLIRRGTPPPRCPTLPVDRTQSLASRPNLPLAVTAVPKSSDFPSAHRPLPQGGLDRVHDVTGRNAELLDQLLRFSAVWNLADSQLISPDACLSESG